LDYEAAKLEELSGTSDARDLQLLGESGGSDGTDSLLCETDDLPKNYLDSSDNCITCEDYFYADRENDECIQDTCDDSDDL
jgi:hypothetical protein